jgi:predicted NAD/FAD-binding protein
MTRVAVVGSGIAGIACADALAGFADVTLIEAAPRLGGHTDTHRLLVDGVTVSVDSGFIVFNRRNYPAFSGWLDELGVASRNTDMSFSVMHRGSGLEYGTDRIAALFAQPSNMARPRFLRMLADIARFYRDALALRPDDAELDVSQFVARKGYGDGFVEDHLLPMCAALWSQPPGQARSIAIGHVVAFMNNHGMLGLRNRPVWQVIEGGSQRYIDAFENRFQGRAVTGLAVSAVRRTGAAVELDTVSGPLRFDTVVLACHPDQALRLLREPTAAERRVLGAIRYQPNRVVVHTDAALMPRRRLAWSSWNASVDADPQAPCTVTYWMNRLQRITTPRPVFVSLNPGARVRASHVLAVRDYAHPVFDRAALAAQRELIELQGVGGLYFAGAWAGYGFHEDGFVSGRSAAAAVQRDLWRHRAA